MPTNQRKEYIIEYKDDAEKWSTFDAGFTSKLEAYDRQSMWQLQYPTQAFRLVEKTIRILDDGSVV